MKRKTAIALGTFDGLHKGHLAVLDLPKDYYKVAVTFGCPPRVSDTDEKELIMSAEDKFKSFKKLGIDEIYSMNFADVKDMEAEAFLEFINRKFSPSLVSCGFNYRFGKKGKGNTDTLEDFCLENDIEFRCVKPVEQNGNVVSSTAIRSLLKSGDVKTADSLLYEPFSFAAEVIHGDSRGRTIGFPTINQKFPEDLVKLKFGVYKAKVCFDGKEYYGITNIGVRPTFLSEYVISETYIKNFSGDLYGKKVRLIPLEFLREEVKFNSVEGLMEQIKKDLID